MDQHRNMMFAWHMELRGKGKYTKIDPQGPQETQHWAQLLLSLGVAWLGGFFDRPCFGLQLLPVRI